MAWMVYFQYGGWWPSWIYANYLSQIYKITSEIYSTPPKKNSDKEVLHMIYDKWLKSYISNMAAGGHLGFMQITGVEFEKERQK